MLRIALALLLVAPSAALGALLPAPTISVTLSAAPAYQIPNSSVTLTAYTQSDGNGYTYTWTVNGQSAGAGAGRNSLTIPTGPAGSVQTVDVTVSDSSGTSGTAEYIVAPADVDLLWEGSTYVPPFYRGRSYPDGESTIVVSAIPHIVENGKELSANALTYTWSIEGKRSASLSGYGRSTARISPSQLKNSTSISVVAESSDGTAAQASISVPTVTPVLVLYENRPLSGLWLERAVSSPFQLTADETTFKAMPYFAANPGALSFSWTLAGKAFTPPGNDPTRVTFRSNGETGTATVEVSAQKQGSIFERMTASLDLSYQ